MSKVIFKSNYTTSSGGAVKNANYIAKRKGVDKSINTKMILNNMDYIANRPRVVKLGEHGLFGQEDRVDIDKVTENLKNHNGIVWQPIISLRREDADRLGYDNPEKWRTLLRSKQVEIAKTYRIPINDLKWYAAFHNEGHHPHVHMIIYNQNPDNEFLTKQGCNNMRESFIKTIFKDDLKHLYDMRQTIRDEIVDEIKKSTTRITLDELNMSDNFAEKYQALQDAIGHDIDHYDTLKYKFLTPKQKKCVDEVVKEIAKEPKVQELYNDWCQIQLTLMGYYSKDARKSFESIENNKEFYRIKNAVLKSISQCDIHNYVVTDEGSALPVYENLLFDICKVINDFTRQSITDCHHSKSIVDSKERIKLMKQKHALGQHFGGM